MAIAGGGVADGEGGPCAKHAPLGDPPTVTPRYLPLLDLM